MERVVDTESPVVLRQFDKATMRTVNVISGISPNAMRRVFGAWILFSAIVGVIVAVAPELSLQFILLTIFVLVSFTLAMFGQSRISEGWPSIICIDDFIGVVRDPMKREFVCVHKSLVKNATPGLIKPNKKAVEILLDEHKLTTQDEEVLKQGVWPRSDRLVGLAHFKKREDVCQRVMACLDNKAAVNASTKEACVS
jgi:hypothetical protein